LYSGNGANIHDAAQTLSQEIWRNKRIREAEIESMPFEEALRLFEDKDYRSDVLRGMIGHCGVSYEMLYDFLPGPGISPEEFEAQRYSWEKGIRCGVMHNGNGADTYAAARKLSNALLQNKRKVEELIGKEIPSNDPSRRQLLYDHERLVRDLARADR